MMFEFNPAFPDATNEQKWDQVRLWRNDQLTKSDWKVLPDSPLNKNLWIEYRQALRDITKQCKTADDVVLPNEPTA